jgi:hypothetical protein
MMRTDISTSPAAIAESGIGYAMAPTNILELDETDRPSIGWCFVPRDNLVAGDVMLAQKIALETDEWGALAVARTFSSRWSAM